MDPIILNRFKNYLGSHSFSKGSITDYLRCVSSLGDPPDSGDPLSLFNYVNQSTQRKEEVSHSEFFTLRASLRSLFQMITGIRFRDFLKQVKTTDKYDPLLTRYAVRAGLNGPIRAGLKGPFTAELKGPISAGLKGPALNRRGK